MSDPKKEKPKTPPPKPKQPQSQLIKEDKSPKETRKK
jgi:hypothetical protein